MTLTDEEQRFLTPYYAEYLNVHRGPAIRAVQDASIPTSDLTWLLEAIRIELRAELLDVPTEQVAPPLPWANTEDVRERNRVMEAEVEAFRAAQPKGRQS